MDPLIPGFWGAFLGAAALMVAGALAALARSLRRVALLAAAAAIAPSLFVLSFLGWIPGWPNHPRLLAHVSMVTSAVLGLMILAMLGLMRTPSAALRNRLVMAALGLVVIGAGWLLDEKQALGLSALAGLAIGIVVLSVCLRRARDGDRLAGIALCGVAAVLVAASGLTWIGMHGGAAWPVHAVSATAATVYLAVMAITLWTRYSYLIELREVIAQGPAYDPITRMRSHAETGQMVGLAFFDQKKALAEGAVGLGVVVVTLGNLQSLERLHGPAAAKHALFVTASRLRRCVPRGVEAGRLGDNGFLLLVPKAPMARHLEDLGRILVERLSRPVGLTTSGHAAEIETRQTDWVAQVGVGVLVTLAGEQPSAAVTQARAMARVALSYPGKVAWLDPATGQIAELPPPGD
jgi:GGDEF domain-containing protein